MLLTAYYSQSNYANQGRVANTRPVATIEKWATGRVMQRLVLARSVGHGETGSFQTAVFRVCHAP